MQSIGSPSHKYAKQTVDSRPGHQKKDLVRNDKVFFSYIRLRRVMMLRSYEMLRIVIIGLAEFAGEYTITKVARLFHNSKL